MFISTEPFVVIDVTGMLVDTVWTCSFPILIKVLLQDTDPSKRPGAGPDGYASVKKHPFFNGVDWKKLLKAPAPRLALDHDVHALTYSAYMLVFSFTSTRKLLVNQHILE